jgi:hypothetical protein
MLKNKIEKAVNKAFKNLDGLAKDVTFQKKVTSEFDFSLGEIKTTATDSITVRGIVFTESKKVGPSTQNVVSLIVQKLPFGLNGYTDVVIENQTYKFKVAESNDFVDVLEVIKEV